MNRGATIVFAPIWLVLGRIPDQGVPDRSALQQTASREGIVSGRREPDSDLCSASGGWGIEATTTGMTARLKATSSEQKRFRQ
jgi:hypothetical protein